MKSRPQPPATPDARLDPLDWLGAAGAQDDVLREMARQQRNRRRKRITGATGAAALLITLFAWQLNTKPLAAPMHSEGGSATVHLHERQTLPDGTVVDLRDGAKLHVAFTPASAGPRRVELASGEAYFQVVKDPARPFIVAMGSVRVRAVGTAFSINRRPSQVEVLVTEGKVAVRSEDRDRNSENGGLQAVGGPSSAGHLNSDVFLEAGERTVVNFAKAGIPQVEAIPEPGIKEAMAWRVPRLEFSGTPLHEALTIINQYSGVKLALGDESLGAVRVSGAIRADNIDALLELLAETKGIHSEHRSETEIILTKAK